MEAGKIEAVFSNHLHRCLDVIDHHKACSVSAEGPEGLVAIARASLQVHHLACAEMPQCGDRLIFGVSQCLAGILLTARGCQSST
jgi:hypothetical protein